MNKLKDISLIFMAGVLAVVFSLLNLLTYLFIEKALALYLIAAIAVTFTIKFIIHMF